MALIPTIKRGTLHRGNPNPSWQVKKNSTQPNPSHKSNLTQSNPSHKFNQTQPKPHELGWTYELDKFFLLLLLINWAKKYKYKYIKKTKKLVSM